MNASPPMPTRADAPRLMPPAIFGISLVIELMLHAVIPTRIISGPWRWLGIVLVAIGLGLNVSQSRAFERRGTPINPFAQPTAFLHTGAYRRTRNPMYLGLVLMLAGTAIVLGSLSPWLVPPVFIWYLTTRFIRREEDRLAATFGTDYHTYRTRVRRWI
jgi:protein-S-isoprenylcysteine O-methyltransferase Ste14